MFLFTVNKLVVYTANLQVWSASVEQLEDLLCAFKKRYAHIVSNFIMQITNFYYNSMIDLFQLST